MSPNIKLVYIAKAGSGIAAVRPGFPPVSVIRYPSIRKGRKRYIALMEAS